MTNSFTTDHTVTRTDSKYIASKVAADLHAMRNYYGKPAESMISDLQEELAELLCGGYVKRVQYGFSRNGEKIVFLDYETGPSGLLQDNNSGGVFARADVSGAEWNSYMTYSEKWRSLSDADKRPILKRITIKREPGQEPKDGNGEWVIDKSYASQGIGIQRKTFRPF